MTTFYAIGCIDALFALNIGGAIVRVHFTGGTIGSNGVIPATFSTENAALIEMIANSEYFGQKKITSNDPELERSRERRRYTFRRRNRGGM